MSVQSDASSTSSIPEEEEPRLKYQRLEADVGDLLLETEAACLCVSEKMLALGTRDGSVHLLDYDGNEVQRFQAHKGPVNDLCFDETAEFIGSCSDDGGAIVHSLVTEEVAKFKYSRPIKSIALDPRYGSRKTREFMTGGLAGQVVLNSRGWLGAKDSIIHSGEGPVPVVRWAGTLVAWANNVCVRVYDAAAHSRIGKLDRPKSSNAEGSSCQLFWDGEQILYMGWHNTVKVCRIKRRAAADVDALRILEVAATFQLESLIAGLAPFGADIAVLAYNTGFEGASPRLPNNMAASAAAAAAATGSATAAEGISAVLIHERPELKILTWAKEEVASDALLITGYEEYEPGEYSLAACCLPRTQASSHARLNGAGTPSTSGRQPTKWWADGEEPIYYVVSPKEIIVSRPRDGCDRVTWLLEHSRYEQALEIIETDTTLTQNTREQESWFGCDFLIGEEQITSILTGAVPHSVLVAGQYLEFLVSQDRYEEAAALMPRLLKDNAAAWERWVYVFAQLRQLAAMAPHIPIQTPRLRQTAYEMMLHAFLLSRSDHSILLALVKEWPTELYSAANLIEAVSQRTRDSGGDTKALLQVAAQLHQIQGRYILALTTFLHQQQCLTLPASIACSSPLHQRKLLHAYRTRAPGGDTEALLQVAAQLYQIWGTYDLALTVSLQQQQCVTLPASFACSSTLHQKMLLHAHRTRAPGGDTEALLQVAAQLYQIQGRYDLALAIFLQQQQPAVFDFIQEHHLLPVLHERVAQLLSIDEERAVALLMQEYDQIPASTVVSSIQAEQHQAQDKGSPDEAEAWRHRLHHYLDQLFHQDQTAGADYHALQVELYADYAPQQLMSFLVSSQWYPLEAALQVCTARGLVREQVFILGRMGSAHQALHVIIKHLADIPQAIEFVQMQRDDELWELLISLSLESPALTGELMDNIGGYVNPLRLLQRMPEGMAIDNLRDRLVHIIADFRTQTSLREGCNTILHTDCLLLAQRLYHEVRKALTHACIRPCTTDGSHNRQWHQWNSSTGLGRVIDRQDLPGPQGSKQLHLRRSEGPDAEDLETVWLGIELPKANDTALASQGSIAHMKQQQRRSASRQTGDIARPPLPSLLKHELTL